VNALYYNIHLNGLWNVGESDGQCCPPKQ